MGMDAADDALEVLTRDHQQVKELFRQYKALGDRAHKGKQDAVEKITHALVTHAYIEEQVLYPRVRQNSNEDNAEVLEALEEHHVVKVLLAELEGMSPQDERFDPKVTVLIESVTHHVKEEEEEMFPRVRKEFSESALRQLGADLEEARNGAPRRPQPAAPDAP